MRRILRQSFFRRSALHVAEGLIGKVLVRKIGKNEIAGMIVEAEAYDGFDDKASHAHRGRTKRNAPMFGNAGRWYVYFVYGMHWLLNIVTGAKGYPAGVLIRGVENISGPARLTKAFEIDGRMSGKKASRATGLWIEDRGMRVPRSRIRRTPRIGVDYADAWAKKPYRFVLDRPRKDA